MFEKLKADILFEKLLQRPDIEKAYAMVPPTDSWYDTITKVHNSLAEIQKLPHEILQLTTHDGLQQQAVYYPNTGDKTVIWVHGYTSHAERESAFPGLFYHSLGFNVLIPYLRAHDKSEGTFISLGALEHLDMMDWVDIINEKHPNGQVLIHGLSMGGGIVLDLACQDMKNVKCLIADAPSVSIPGFFQNITHHAFKKNQEKIYQLVKRRFKKEFGADLACFDRVDNITSGKYPLLLTAGSEEGMDEVLAQLKARNPSDTSVLILPGCNHGNGMYKQTEMYQTTIKEFITQHMDV